MAKYYNKYRIESVRLQNWDYGWNGSYFITICTRHHHRSFGKIINKEIVLNCMGEIALKGWCEIPDHFKFVKLGDHCVMPNHVHGIINIDKLLSDVEPTHALALHIQNRFQNQGKGTISSIIGSYKSAVTKLINKQCCPQETISKKFGWQSRFHDHIIRSQKEYDRISHYITNNEKNWKDDKFFSE